MEPRILFTAVLASVAICSLALAAQAASSAPTDGMGLLCGLGVSAMCAATTSTLVVEVDGIPERLPLQAGMPSSLAHESDQPFVKAVEHGVLRRDAKDFENVAAALTRHGGTVTLPDGTEYSRADQNTIRFRRSTWSTYRIGWRVEVIPVGDGWAVTFSDSALANKEHLDTGAEIPALTSRSLTLSVRTGQQVALHDGTVLRIEAPQ